MDAAYDNYNNMMDTHDPARGSSPEEEARMHAEFLTSPVGRAVFGNDSNSISTFNEAAQTNQDASKDALPDAGSASKKESNPADPLDVNALANRQLREEDAVATGPLLKNLSSDLVPDAPTPGVTTTKAPEAASTGDTNPKRVSDIERILANSPLNGANGRQERLVLLGNDAIKERFLSMAVEAGMLKTDRTGTPNLKATSEEVKNLFNKAAAQHSRETGVEHFSAKALTLNIPYTTKILGRRQFHKVEVQVSGTKAEIEKQLKGLETLLSKGEKGGYIASKKFDELKDGPLTVEGMLASAKNGARGEEASTVTMAHNPVGGGNILQTAKAALADDRQARESFKNSKEAKDAGLESSDTPTKETSEQRSKYVTDTLADLSKGLSTSDGLSAMVEGKGGKESPMAKKLVDQLQGIDKNSNSEFASLPTETRRPALANMVALAARLETATDLGKGTYSAQGLYKAVPENQGTPLREKLDGWLKAEMTDESAKHDLQVRLESLQTKGIINNETFSRASSMVANGSVMPANTAQATASAVGEKTNQAQSKAEAQPQDSATSAQASKSNSSTETSSQSSVASSQAAKVDSKEASATQTSHAADTSKQATTTTLEGATATQTVPTASGSALATSDAKSAQADVSKVLAAETSGAQSAEKADLAKSTDAAINRLGKQMKNPQATFLDDKKDWNMGAVEKMAQEVTKLDSASMAAKSPAERSTAAAYANWLADGLSSGKIPSLAGEKGAALQNSVVAKASELKSSMAEGPPSATAAKNLSQADKMLGAMAEHSRVSGASSAVSFKAPSADASSAVARLTSGAEQAKELLLSKEPTEMNAGSLKFIVSNASTITKESLAQMPAQESKALVHNMREAVQSIRSGESALGAYGSLSDAVKNAVDRTDKHTAGLEAGFKDAVLSKNAGMGSGADSTSGSASTSKSAQDSMGTDVLKQASSGQSGAAKTGGARSLER